MEDYFLSEAEELVVDTIKAYFYDPNFSIESVRISMYSIDRERKSVVLEAAYIQVSAEQAQRARYIASVLSPTEEVNRGKSVILAENLYFYASNNKQAELFSKLGIKAEPNNLSDEAMEQAKIYQATSEHLTLFASSQLMIQKINPIFPSLNSLSTENLQELGANISKYISSVNEMRKEDLAYNPDFPRRMIEILTAAKLHLTLQSIESMGRKVEFMRSVLTISEGIVANRTENIIKDEDKLKMAIAKLMYTYNASFEYVI